MSADGNTNRIINADVLSGLAQLDSDSIDCIITSPPYWGLRDYGDSTKVIWDGDKNCKHEWLTFKGDNKGKTPEERLQQREHALEMGYTVRIWGGSESTQGTYDRSHIPDSDFCSKCGAWYGQLGLEPSLDLYLSHLLQVTAELKRVLKPTGVVFWNHGDSYSSMLGKHGNRTAGFSETTMVSDDMKPPKPDSIPEKCMIMQNYRLVLRMIDEQGWILRNTIIWHKCLSGSTKMFAYVDGKPIVAYLKDLLRLSKNSVIEFPSSDGNKTKLLSWSKSMQSSVHILFRDGTEITCSENHRFVTNKDMLVEAKDLKKGVVIKKVRHNLFKLNEGIWDYNWGWFIGLYLAEGNKDRKGIRLSLSKDEQKWIPMIESLFKPFGIVVNPHIYKNNLAILIPSYIATGIIDTFVRGAGAKGKRLTREAFMYGEEFVKGIIDGWLDGDGSYEKYNNRWKASISRNSGMVDDLRACALISGYMFRSNLGYTKYQHGTKPCIRITVRKTLSANGYNRKSDTEIIRVTKNGEHNLYDIEVDGNHLFTLLNGALSHNSNHMPSSVRDRFAASYEPIFMLVKNQKYWFDLDAVRVPQKEFVTNGKRGLGFKPRESKDFMVDGAGYKQGGIIEYRAEHGINYNPLGKNPGDVRDLTKHEIATGRIGNFSYEDPLHQKPLNPSGKNPGDIWNIPTQPFSGAHFATFPEKLIEPMVKAGCPAEVCKKCGKARERISEKELVVHKEFNDKGKALDNVREGSVYEPAIPRARTGLEGHNEYKTIGWTDCGCGAGFESGIVLDPFMGAGTTALVALENNRRFIGIELNPEYVKMAYKRIEPYLCQKKVGEFE